MKHGLDFTPHELIVLALGMVTAFVVSIFALKFLVGYVRKHDFKPFGYYRIAVGVIILIYFAAKAFIAA